MALDKQRLLVVTDLLMGAAYADSRIQGGETEAVRKILDEIALDKALLAGAEQRIKSFNPDEFNLKKAATKFNADPPLSKRKLLEFVSAISHADGELDLDEDDYLRDLAEALGMGSDEYSDLALDYEVETLKDDFDIVVSVPPPMPAKASQRPKPKKQ